MRDLQPLQPGDTVWIPENKSEGTIVEQSDPRSYTMRVQNGTIRRNRRDLIVLPDPRESVSPEEQNSDGNGQEQTQDDRNTDTTSSETGTRKTRSGRTSKPPERLEQNWTWKREMWWYVLLSYCIIIALCNPCCTYVMCVCNLILLCIIRVQVHIYKSLYCRIVQFDLCSEFTKKQYMVSEPGLNSPS